MVRAVGHGAVRTFRMPPVSVVDVAPPGSGADAARRREDVGKVAPNTKNQPSRSASATCPVAAQKRSNSALITAVAQIG